MKFSNKTSIEIAELIRRRNASATEVVEECIATATAKRSLNALTYVASREARADATRIDIAIERGEQQGRLCGVPIVVKDAICTEGLPTTAGSRILQRMTASGPEGWRAPYTASAVARLQAEGAIVLAKANMDEFAMGSSNENSAYGAVRNPHDETRVPGGSSGGSAAAVAAGIAPAALGSDTGGSIRQPASFCGIVGVKPSYGRVSRYGLVAYASSFDQIGPMTSDVRSAARFLEVMAGDDPKDSTTAQAPVGSYELACDRPLANLRFGLPEEYFGEGLDPRVRETIEDLIEKVRRAGCEVKPVRLPHTHYGVATYYVLATAEASSNLSRFDGIRFGLRVEEQGADLAKIYAASRTNGFGDEVKRRILLGTYVLSAGYYDAYYQKAQRVRTLIRRDFDQVFSEVDAILSPASPIPAFKLGERMSDPLSMYLADIYTLPASLAGIAAISVPVGTVDGSGSRLPVGVQIMCPALAEEAMFQAAAGIEQLVSDG